MVLDNDMDTAQELDAELATWSLGVVVVDGGSYDRPSKFACTIMRRGQSHTIEYSKGAGHRVWRKGAGSLRSFCTNTKVFGRVMSGKPATVAHGYKLADQSRAEFDRLTAAEPPTVAEVLDAMLRDAACVRHGQTFAEFCREFGYDEDSRKAEKIFSTCRDEWAALVRLSDDVDKLEQLFGQ